MKILFICRANAGRSQMAEAFYNKMTNSHDATSAGVDLKNSVKGDDPSIPELVIEVMKEVGIDMSEKKRKVVTPQMAEAAEKVIIITDHPMPEYLKDSHDIEMWLDIPDAVRTPIEFHREVRDMVERKVQELVKN